MASKTDKVEKALRALVEQSAPGTVLPSEAELMTEHRVSRPTVRSAMARLAQEGLVENELGQRWKVRLYAPLYWNLSKFERGTRRDNVATGTDEWKADMASQGTTSRYEISVAILPIPREFAACLDIAPDTLALRRRRLRYADEVPVAIADTWVREDVGRRTINGRAPLLETGDVTLPGGIFHALGLTMATLKDEITVRMPTPEEQQLLMLTVGSPVGQVTRTGLLEDGQPIRVLTTVFPGHRLKVRYEQEV